MGRRSKGRVDEMEGEGEWGKRGGEREVRGGREPRGKHGRGREGWGKGREGRIEGGK